MTHHATTVDVLSGDVFSLIANFLTGFDLLRLSHVNRKLFTELLAPTAHEWQRRVPAAATSNAPHSAKVRYFQLTSVRFLGREAAETTTRARGGAVEVWSRELPSYWWHDSFSLEISFALLRPDHLPTASTHIGGVLFGAQSVPWSTKRWAHYHQQFVHVDPLGNLYCSVLDNKIVVAETLQLQRWYHIVLTFDRSDASSVLPTEGHPTQRVFLDGTLVHETTGFLHRECLDLRYGQIGSGCISGGSPGKPTADFTGWYGFHGVVDDCRLWRGALQPNPIRRLAQGDSPIVAEDDGCGVEWSLHESGYDPLGFASRVQCTRPQERVCTAVRDLDDADN